MFNVKSHFQNQRDLSLWFNFNFLKLWLGQTVSELGSQITTQALPLTAVVFLKANPQQMGLLSASISLPALLGSLFIGVWVDRKLRRPLLIKANIGRMLLLGLVPLSALIGVLRMEYLYVLSFLIGFLTVLFDIAVTSYLPALMKREQLIEGNTKLQLSSSIAVVAGPSLGALTIQFLTAPIAIFLDALSFLFSAICLTAINGHEENVSNKHRELHIWHEIGEGLGMIWKNNYLRIMTVSSCFGSFALVLQQTVLFLYLVNELKLLPLFIGIMFSTRGISSLLGSAIASLVGKRLGIGLAISLGTFLTGLASCLLLIGFGPVWVTILGLITAQIFFGLGMPIYSVNQVSLRQTVTPAHLLGRVNASRRFIVFGVSPIGALVGGLLGTIIGLYLTLVISAVVMLLSFLVVFLSPLKNLRTLPATSEN